MPNYSTYPTGNDIELLLKTAKLWPSDSDENAVLFSQEQAAIAASGAAAEFERRTGWLPFLADSANSTRTFETTDLSGVLDLGGSVLSVAGVNLGERELTLDRDYWLVRTHAGRPVTRLQFLWPHHASLLHKTPADIAVNARWGYTATVPADVWAAIQKYAGVLVLTSLENRQGTASITQDGFSKAYDVVGIISQKDLLTTWGKDFDKHCRRYIRVV